MAFSSQDFNPLGALGSGDISSGLTFTQAQAGFLEMFFDMVQVEYQEKTFMDDKQLIKTIGAGSSWSFPIIGQSEGKYHTPSNDVSVNLTATPIGKRVVTIDAIMYDAKLFDYLDESLAHFESLMAISNNMINGLTRASDMNSIYTLIMGARMSSQVTGMSNTAGTALVDANFDFPYTSAKKLRPNITVSNVGANTDGTATSDAVLADAYAEALWSSAITFREKSIPEEEPKYAVLRPGAYYRLGKGVQANGYSVVHSDYNGRGSHASGQVMELAGIKLFNSMNIPNRAAAGSDPDLSALESTTALGGFHNKQNTLDTAGVVFATNHAVCLLRKFGLSMKHIDMPEKLAKLLLLFQGVGHGVLRPECCIELSCGNITEVGQNGTGAFGQNALASA